MDNLSKPASLKRALVDALADTEQLRHRLDAAQQAADDFEHHVEAVAGAGLIAIDGRLLEDCRIMTSATQAAAAAAVKVAGDMTAARESL